MGFAGFVTGGLVPAVGGALKGVNERARMAEEQRRYNTQQAGIESQRKWQQQQAIEAAQRQAAMDELTRTIQMAGIKNQAERNAIDMERASHVAQPSESYQEMVGPKGPGVYGVTEGQAPRYLGGIVPKPKVGTGDGTDGGKTLSPGVAKQFFDNRSALQTLRTAQQQVKAHPDAFGLMNYVPQRDRFDTTENVSARAPVGNIGSMVIHDRSGAAVTVAEMPRLRPFIPQATDPPNVVASKLAELERQIAAITDDMTTYYTDQGYHVPGDTAPPAALARPGANPSAVAQPQPKTDARTRAQQLKDQGYSKDDALTVLKNEGYIVE